MSIIRKPQGDITAQIVQLIKDQPGLSRVQITEYLGITDPQKKANISPVLSGMKAIGLITSEKMATGLAHVYYLADGATDQSHQAPAHAKATPPELAELTDVSLAIADMVVKAIEGPVRAKVEQTIQDIIQQATANFQERVMAAIGQIPNMVIPISVPMSINPVPTLRQTAPMPEPAPKPAPELEPIRPLHVVPHKPIAKPKITVELDQPEPPPAKWTPYVAPQAEPETESEPNKSRIKITVVGLKAGQAHMIRNEFGRQMKLTFIESDGGHGQQLGALSRTNDYIILMTKFINHATLEHIKKNGGNPIECTGGMTALRDTITNLYVEHDDKQKATEAIAA